MAEFFGDLERLAADLYPWRYLIGVGFLILIAGIAAFGYFRGWHTWISAHRLPLAIVGVPVLALIGFLAYDLGSPLFTNVTVEEEFPLAFKAIVPADMSRKDVEEVMAVLARVDQEAVEEPMPNMAKKQLPAAAPRTPSTALAAPAPAPAAPSTSAEPVKLKTGSFRDADSFHRGSGQATIYLAPDGTHLLRLENLDVTNGPDLHVILSPHQNPDNRVDLKTPGYVDLGKLKGNRGNQNYQIPATVDVALQGSVVIYCAPFHVIFSVAPLQNAG